MPKEENNAKKTIKPKRSFLKSSALGLALILIGVFYIATIREGHSWGDDFAMYIQHAKNIAAGVDYNKSGAISNPYLILWPKAYPAAFPLLLAPVYMIFGMSLAAMKITIIIFFLCALLAIYKVFKERLPLRYPLLAVALLGLHPYFWDFKDDILSDIPFLFFIYLAVFTIGKIYSEPAGKKKIGNIAFAGFLFSLCWGLKNMGAVLIPALFVYDLMRERRITLFPFKVVLAFGVFTAAQYFLFGFDSTNLSLIFRDASLGASFRNLISYYPNLFVSFWDNGYFKAGAATLSLTACIAAIIGLFYNIKNKASFREIFFLVYAAFIILFPIRQGIRLIIPLIPLYIGYALTGIDCLIAGAEKSRKKIFLTALALIIFASYAGKYSKAAWGRIPEGIGREETIELFDFVKANTKEDEAFIFFKPRAFYLFTGRRASVLHKAHDDIGAWRYLESINAAYALTYSGRKDFLNEFIGRNKDNFQEVYRNADFTLYRILK